MPTALLVGKAEELVLEALAVRLSERYLPEKLGIGPRSLRRSFLDERGATPYVVLRQLRLQEAQRRLQAKPDLSLTAAAQQCGFGHYALFQHDLENCTFARRRPTHLGASKSGAALLKGALREIHMQEASLQPVE